MKIYTKFYADTVVVKRVGWVGQFKRILFSLRVRALCILTSTKTSQSMKFTFYEKEKLVLKIIHIFIF